MPRNEQSIRQWHLLRRLEGSNGLGLHELVDSVPDDFPKNARTVRRDLEAQLLEQPDVSLVRLKKLPARQRAGLLKLLTSDPVKRFLVCVSQKEFRFRVADPGVR